MKFDTVVSPLREGGKKDEDAAGNGMDTAIMEGTEQGHSVFRPVIGFEIVVSLSCLLYTSGLSLSAIYVHRPGRIMICHCCHIKKQQCYCNTRATVNNKFLSSTDLIVTYLLIRLQPRI